VSKLKDHHRGKWLEHALEHGTCLWCDREVTVGDTWNVWDCIPEHKAVWRKVLMCNGCHAHRGVAADLETPAVRHQKYKG